MFRKTFTFIETITADSSGKPCTPITRVAIGAIVSNPFAGHYGDDLSPLFEIGGAFGETFAGPAVGLFTGTPVSYGKAALVGVNGHMEHGGALVHPKLGAPMRAACGGGAAVIPSNVKVAAIGSSIDLPLGHKDNPWSFDHFDTMTLSVGDAPAPDEILIWLAYADGERPHARCGSGPVST